MGEGARISYVLQPSVDGVAFRTPVSRVVKTIAAPLLGFVDSASDGRSNKPVYHPRHTTHHPLLQLSWLQPCVGRTVGFFVWLSFSFATTVSEAT